MINLGLSSLGQARFERALAAQGRTIEIRVAITDLEHKDVEDVSGMLLDGQVNIDTTAKVSRSATLSLMDPSRTVGLDSNSPGMGQAYLDRMVRIEYGVDVPLEGMVFVPVFYGPVTGVSRNEEIIEVEAQGKEFIARRAGWRTRSFAKGLTRVGVIRKIMEEMTGETRFNFPRGWTARTAKPLSMSRMSSPWSHALILARSMNAQLFYDGAGVLRLRKKPLRNFYTFRDGNGGVVTTRPDVEQASEDLVNTVHVKGGVPKGAKTAVESVAYIPVWHRQSHSSLSRNGVGRYHVETIEDDTLRTAKEVDEAARRRVREIISDSADVSFDCLPVPHLEENDLVRVEAGGVVTNFRLRKMTIPLAHSGVSTVGYLRRVSSYRGYVRADRTFKRR